MEENLINFLVTLLYGLYTIDKINACFFPLYTCFQSNSFLAYV